MRDVPRTRGCSLPSTMLAHIPGPSAKPSSNTTPMSGRETSHSSQYPRKKHLDVAPKFELPNSHQLPSSKLESRRRQTKGSVVGEEWCQNAARLRWYTKNVFAQSRLILSRAWLHDTVSCAAWNDARKGVDLKPLFKTPCSNCYWGWSKPIMLDYRDISLMESVPLLWRTVTASPVGIEPMTILGGRGGALKILYNWYLILYITSRILRFALLYWRVSSVSSKEPSIQHRLEGSLHDVPTRPSRVVCEPPSWAHGGIPSAQLHSRPIKMEMSLLCGFMWNYPLVI